MTYAELEFTLRARDDGYAVDLRFRAPDSAADSNLALDVPVFFDLDKLLSLSHDWSAYGRELTDYLFADPCMREAWSSVRGFIQSAPTPLRLRLRLRINPGADKLHGLRWELLQDPATDLFLCRSERVLFARYLDTDDLARITVHARADLRALVAVSNPSDLEKKYEMAPVDVEDDLSRICTALGDIPITRLASRPHGTGITQETLIDALRADFPLLVLVCHGSMDKEDRPILWLEHDDGTSDLVAGEMLVQRITDLDPDRRPLLIILAACQTAGRDQHAAVLSALGPQLACAGIGAVIGMQGSVPMALITALLPHLLSHLREDGQIDRALAMARAALPDDQPWWMPVLFMRVRDGRLWNDDPPKRDNPVPQIAEGLGALLELLRTPAVHTAGAIFRNDFAAARAQVADVIALKDVHDLLHTLQFQCYIPLTREARSFPNDDLACDSIADYALTLRSRTVEIQAAFMHAPEVLGEGAWVADLVTAGDTLHQALARRDSALLKQAIWQINRVLAVQPSYINANLIARARGLRVRTLVEAMHALRVQLQTVTTDTVRLARFIAGVDALADLRVHLESMISDHDAWQAIDREVRRISESLRHDTSELELSWPDLRGRLATRATDEADWTQALRGEMAQLDLALGGDAGLRPGAIFQRCNRIIGERFFQVDVNLKHLCSQLRELGDPLAELERILT